MEVLVRDERVPRQRNVTAAYYAFFASRFIPKCVCDFWFSFLAYGRRTGKVGNR